MVWPLLRRGLVCGVIAGLVAGLFAFVVGEPLVQDAIDIESASASLTLAHISDWTVSRGEQRGGLFLATALYGACVGTIFTLAFAVLRGRVGVRSDWHLSVWLAVALFVALVLVPWLKYPANPAAVGDPETIGQRTWTYLVLLAGTAAALVAAWRVWARTSSGAVWRRPLLAAGTFVVLVVVLVVALPGVDEVPDGFPASLLWEFRLSALGTQATLWTALGIGYGIASARATAPA